MATTLAAAFLGGEGRGVKKLMCNTSLLSDVCIKFMN